MKRIAISAEDNRGLESVVGPHFGRCPYFIMVDLEGAEVKTVKAIENPFYGNHQPGQVPAFIHSQAADVMLAGGMGARAIQFFNDYGIDAATGASGTVRVALDRYLKGELYEAAACASSEHHHHHDSSGYERDELGGVREEAEMLQQQLDEVERRLQKLGQE